MGVLDYILLSTTIAGAVGWFFAWRSRGEALDARSAANDAGERARLAEAATEAARSKTLDAMAGRVTAEAELKVATAARGALENNLAAERRTKGDLLEKLAKAGVPVGADLVDSVLDRLYANGNRGETGGGSSPGPDHDPVGLPGDAAGAAGTSDEKR